MFRNYFIIAIRNFWRNKFFSLINIIGLAIGISASLVIYLIVSYDFSFDKFEKDGDRIYRVVSDMKFPDMDFKNAGAPLPLIQSAQKELTGVETFIPLSTPNGEMNVTINPALRKYKRQTNIVFADNNLLNMLSCKVIAGSAQNLLKEPFSTVLTESRARAYFPGNDVSKDIGKIITYNDSIKTTVTAIVKDLDQTTDFTFKEFISYSTIENSGLKYNAGWDKWGSVSSRDQFFIKLNKGISAATVTKKIQQLFDKNQKDAYLKNIFSLQPLSDIHFNNAYGSLADRTAHKPTLYALLAVAAVLLILACINFINLTTAQSVQRAKEIGIRKTMGSSKNQLIFQFLSETFLLTFIATILSIVFVPLIIKLFSGFIPDGVHAGMLLNNRVIIFIVLLLFLVTLLAGYYPAIVLSKYKPVLVLKNQSFSNSSITRSAWIRKTLTVTQFVFAQAFIIATLIVGTQIRFMLHKDLGFKKDGIISIETPINENDFSDKAVAAKSLSTRKFLLQKIQAIPGISVACIAGTPPATSGTAMRTMKFNNGKKQIETTVDIKYADEDYFKLYHLPLLAGRYVKRSDSLTEYVINETYARFLGFKNPSDAVGKFIGDDKQIPIVGVVYDFYARSLHSEIKPLAFYSQLPVEYELHIALKPETSPNEWSKTIKQIEKAYKQVYPDEIFDCDFVDESIAKFYKAEQHTSTLLSWATGLAILISCLGLLGLVIYTTNQRIKEIGVRKVLGATVSQIVTLISKDFIKLVLLAFIIAVPIAWWGMNKWLQSFAYRTEISWWLFVTDGALMIVIALLTLGFQTIKAASANPVKSLRAE